MGKPSTYDRLGGAQGITRLVKIFYDTVETDPVGEPLMRMHNRGNGLAHARQAQFEFLSGFTGGPQLYREQHGPMDLHEIHAHLDITPVESHSWVACMDKALTQFGAEPDLHAYLMNIFRRVAVMLEDKR